MRKDFGIRRYVEIKGIGTAAWLAQLGESAGLLSGRSQVQTLAGPTLRVFK